MIEQARAGEFSREGRGARRHLGAVICVYLVHLALAVGLGWPLAKLLGDPTLALPRGDLVLFEPGGFYLSEVLRLGRTALVSVIEGTSFLVLLTTYLGLVPLGALLFALSDPERMNVRTGLVAATRFFGPFSLLLGMTVLAMALAGAVPLIISSLLETKLKSVLGDRAYDMVTLSFRLAGVASVAVVGVVHDLARAAVVTRDVAALDAAVVGVATLRAYPGRALGAWALRAGLGVALIFAGAWVTALLAIRSGALFASVTVLHQAIAFGLVFLRADWLSSAVHLVRALPAHD